MYRSEGWCEARRGRHGEADGWARSVCVGMKTHRCCAGRVALCELFLALFQSIAVALCGEVKLVGQFRFDCGTNAPSRRSSRLQHSRSRDPCECVWCLGLFLGLHYAKPKGEPVRSRDHGNSRTPVGCWVNSQRVARAKKLPFAAKRPLLPPREAWAATLSYLRRRAGLDLRRTNLTTLQLNG